MWFTFLLTGSNRSQTTIESVHPHTGERLEYHSFALTQDELADARAVLARHGAKDARTGEKVVALSDGGEARVELGGVDGPWMVSIDALSEAAVDFLFQLTCGGNFLIEGDGPPVVTSLLTKVRLGERGRDCTIARSSCELLAFLTEGERSSSTMLAGTAPALASGRRRRVTGEASWPPEDAELRMSQRRGKRGS